MPYKLQKKGDKWCVINKDTGDDKGCSDTRAMAVKHMRALYAAAGAEAKAYHPDASYISTYIAYCNSLIDQAQYSFQYGDTEHEELAAFSERLIDFLSDAETQLVQWRNQWYGSPDDFKQDEKGLVARVVEAAKDALGLSEKPTSSITFTKDADTGRIRVMMRVSNNFKDRHGEIITEEAHKEYEAYVAREKDYPEFQLWHTPGSRWGQADLVSFDDGFLTVSGLVDPGMEYIAEGLSKQSGLGVSHGFKGWGLGDGLIHWYRMKECSPLPRVEAANVLTDLAVLEKDRGMNDKKKKFFTDLGVPSAVIEDWDKSNKDLDALAKQAGFEFKDVEGEPPKPDGEPPKPPEEPNPDEAKQVEVEVTLPNGAKTKAMVPAELVETPTPSDAPEWAKELIQSNKALKDELDQLKAAKTVDQWEAAIKNGTGFVASKEGEPPSASEQKDNGEWLAQLIAGGSN